MTRKVMTHEQKVLLIEAMERNSELYKRRRDTVQSRMKYRNLWKQLALRLNTVPRGVQKTETDWQKCWNQIKSKVKRKRAGASRAPDANGPLFLEFNEYELRVLQLLDSEPVEGLQDGDDEEQPTEAIKYDDDGSVVGGAEVIVTDHFNPMDSFTDDTSTAEEPPDVENKPLPANHPPPSLDASRTASERAAAFHSLFVQPGETRDRLLEELVRSSNERNEILRTLNATLCELVTQLKKCK